MSAGVERSDKITAINNILRGQEKSRSRVNLSVQDEPDRSLPAKIKVQSISSASMSKLKKYKQDHLQQKCITNRIKYSRVAESVYGEKGHDELQDMDLPPYSKVTSLRSKFTAAQPQTKVTTSRLIQSNAGSNFVSDRPINHFTNQHQMRRPKNDSLKKKITNIPFQTVKRYFETHPSLFQQRNTPQHIYQLLSSFIETQKVEIDIPLIKQYRNCVYFGQQVHATKSYEGFLIFFINQKLYYGQLINEKKNGHGTEIDFVNDIVSVGRFQNGKKIGRFTVVTPKQRYEGQLYNGLYHGYGILITNTSIYKGYFQNGCRHGQGQQYFPQTNLTICGVFIFNRFTNDQHKIQYSRISKGKVRQPKIDNPEDCEGGHRVSRYRKDHSYQQYEYELRTKEGIVQNKWNSSNMFRVKRRSHRRSIEQEDPLCKKIH